MWKINTPLIKLFCGKLISCRVHSSTNFHCTLMHLFKLFNVKETLMKAKKFILIYIKTVNSRFVTSYLEKACNSEGQNFQIEDEHGSFVISLLQHHGYKLYIV